MKLAQRFFAVANANPNKIALRHGTTTTTYEALAQKVHKMAVDLRKNKIGNPEKECVTILGSSPEMITGILATWHAGAIAVPLCPAHTKDEQQYVIDDSGAVVAVRGTNIVRGNPTEASSSKTLKGKEEDALLIYTSGTTARPKGAVHTNDSINSQISILHDAWRWTADDVILNNLPLHHVHGLVNISLCALMRGATVVYDDFAPDKTLRQLRETDVNLFMTVPTAYAKLCEAFPRVYTDAATRAAWTSVIQSKMRLFVSGSAALPVPLLDRFGAMSGSHILERYGMTETGMILSQPYEPVADRRPGTVGRPLPGVEVHVGGEGELSIRSPSLFDRYWNRPAEVTEKEFIDVDGKRYFRTGDTVGIDADGFYSILGRTSVDIVKVSGFKVSTLEVEAVILQMDGVREVSVFGVPDDVYGETMVAVVHPTGSAATAVTSSSVLAHCQQHLAKYKLPRVVHITPRALPRNAMGKINKKQMAKVGSWN